jgi:hypothetical protein
MTDYYFPSIFLIKHHVHRMEKQGIFVIIIIIITDYYLLLPITTQVKRCNLSNWRSHNCTQVTM